MQAHGLAGLVGEQTNAEIGMKGYTCAALMALKILQHKMLCQQVLVHRHYYLVVISTTSKHRGLRLEKSGSCGYFQTHLCRMTEHNYVIVCIAIKAGVYP